jgi:hypothetical protein
VDLPENKSAGVRDDNTLEKWYKDYMAVPYFNSEPLYNDALDMEVIEKEIQDLERGVKISEGLCANCHELARSLPQFIHCTRPEQYPVTRPHFKSHYQWEASCRAGCDLCNLFMQGTRHRYSLTYFRRVERRLNRLEKDGTIHVSIVRRAFLPQLYLNLPGYISREIFMDGLAVVPFEDPSTY